MKKDKDEEIIKELLSGKRGKKYNGKQVVVIDGEVYILPRNDMRAKELFNKLMADHPRVTPTIVSVPRQGSYILLIH